MPYQLSRKSPYRQSFRTCTGRPREPRASRPIFSPATFLAPNISPDETFRTKNAEFGQNQSIRTTRSGAHCSQGHVASNVENDIGAKAAINRHSVGARSDHRVCNRHTAFGRIDARCRSRHHRGCASGFGEARTAPQSDPIVSRPCRRRIRTRISDAKSAI